MIPEIKKSCDNSYIYILADEDVYSRISDPTFTSETVLVPQDNLPNPNYDLIRNEADRGKQLRRIDPVGYKMAKALYSLLKDQKIQAIKIIKEATELSLLEAKNCVDIAFDELKFRY